MQAIVEIPAPFQTFDVVRQRPPLLDARQRGEDLAVAQQLRQRGVHRALRLLRNVSQYGMGFDVPDARPIPPGDQAQQLGFADAVAPHQATARPIESEIQRAEQRFAVSKLAGQLM